MVRKTLLIVLVVAVVALIANDVWRYTQATQRLRDTTYTISRWAAENAPSSSRDDVAAEIVQMARPSGVTVTMYGQSETGVQVWTQTEVPGVIVAGTLVNLLQGMSFSEARNSPLTIKDYRVAGIQ